MNNYKYVVIEGPIGSDADFELLLARIDGMRGKREFFNRGE